MSDRRLIAFITGKGRRNLVFAAIVLICVVLLIVLSRSVIVQLRGLDTATSDNLQWTLGQLDVEYLQMRQSVSSAASEQELGRTPDLETLRQKFDIFYSRLDTFRASEVYAPLRTDADFNTDFDAAWVVLQDMVPIIDSDDAALKANLPALNALAERAAEPVRTMALQGLVGFAKESDQRREAIFRLLIRLALVSLVLLMLISLLALTSSRLYRLSERHAAEQRRTGTRLKTIVDCSLDGIITCDAEGRILDWNDAATRIFQHRRDAVAGKGFLRLILAPENYAAQIEMITGYIESGGSRRAEGKRIHLQARRADGDLFPLEMSIEFTRGAGAMMYVAFLRDISNRLKNEADLRAARDSALAGEKAKAQFLAVMSHEMRTPLNGLLGTLSLLRDSELDDQQRQMLDTMDVSGRLLLSHVHDVLDLSKFESGLMKAERSPFLLSRVLNEVVTNLGGLARDQGNSLSWHWEGREMEHAIGDATRLRQILINLVSNAVKFTRNGDILIEAEVQEAPGGGQDNVVEFRVIDTGIGIADEDQERIFQDFETVDSSYSRTTGGTGLGLGIARRLTKVLNGEIGVESTLGEGSVFWLRVPLSPASAADFHDGQHRLATPDRPGQKHRLAVLVVEDNMINRKLLRAMIEKEGHEVAEATNGHEGVEVAAATCFDLILMDISMPVMDGVQAAQAIRHGKGASRHSTIVAVTAHALPEELESFRANGMSQCLAKPIDRETLRDLLFRAQRGEGADLTPVRASEPASDHLDMAVFQSLIDSVGAAPLNDLIGRFIEETDQVMAKVAGLEGGPDQEAPILKDLHHCAGAAAIFGAKALRQSIHRIETDAKRQVPGVVKAAKSELAAIWQQTRQQIVALQPGPTRPHPQPFAAASTETDLPELS